MSVFDVLREKLEESQDRYDDVAFVEMNENGHTLDFEYANGKKDGVSESIEIVNKVEQEYNNGWIPCSERLPEDTGEYIVTIDGATRATTLSYDEVFCNWTDDDCLEYPVIAWKPLPPKYEQKGE